MAKKTAGKDRSDIVDLERKKAGLTIAALRSGGGLATFVLSAVQKSTGTQNEQVYRHLGKGLEGHFFGERTVLRKNGYFAFLKDKKNL